jgi:hypothetical protein
MSYTKENGKITKWYCRFMMNYYLRCRLNIGTDEASLKKDKSFMEFAKFVSDHMRKVNRYHVDMKVDVGVGKSWGEIKELDYSSRPTHSSCITW